jgi:hypothetical protein
MELTASPWLFSQIAVSANSQFIRPLLLHSRTETREWSMLYILIPSPAQDPEVKSKDMAGKS